MKILVTGGAGFIGSHIVEKYIDAGHEVVIIDNLSTGRIDNINPGARFIDTDITSKAIRDIFIQEKFDILNHHAAQVDVRTSVRDPLFDLKQNILGSVNLYEAAKDSGVKKIIFASSGGTVYGEQTSFPADESHITQPVSPYGITKLTNEKYLHYYFVEYGIKHVIFRYTNVYGPRQNPHGECGVVAIFINKMLNGEQPVINGDGRITRDYVYVGDVASANLIALNENTEGIYNICTGIEQDVNYIFNTLKQHTGSDCKELHGSAKAGEQLRSVCSYEKINKTHGWKPSMNISEGLALTVESFRINTC
jgi:UDP-glucose 4-epimerase